MNERILDERCHTLDPQNDHALFMERTQGSCDTIVEECGAEKLRYIYAESVRQVAFMHNEMRMEDGFMGPAQVEEKIMKGDDYVFIGGLLDKIWENEAWNDGATSARIEGLQRSRRTSEQEAYYQALVAIDADYPNFIYETVSSYDPIPSNLHYRLNFLHYYGRTHGDLALPNIHVRKDDRIVLLDPWLEDQYSWQNTVADFAYLAVGMKAHLLKRFKHAVPVGYGTAGCLLFSDPTLSDIAAHFRPQVLQTGNPVYAAVGLFVNHYIGDYMRQTGNRGFSQRLMLDFHQAHKARLGAILSAKHNDTGLLEAYMQVLGGKMRDCRRDISEYRQLKSLGSLMLILDKLAIPL
jgi:hypothetical protein